MKVNFLTRVNTWLFVIPALLILILYLGIGAWFYFSGATFVLRDFHSAQLATMLSDKRNVMDLWIDVRKKAVDDIAKSSVVAGGVQDIIKAESTPKEEMPVASQDKRQIDAAADARQKLSRVMDGFSQFKEVSIISKDGKVIWDTNSEAIGHEWNNKEILKAASSGRTEVVSTKPGLWNGPEMLMFIASVAGEGQNSDAVIIAVPNAADLAASLKVEKGFYETGKVSIIDGNGNVVAAKDMTDVGKIKYNINHQDNEEVGYREGFYYTAMPLKSSQLRLIATLDAIEAAKPLKSLGTVYLAFAALIVFVILLQILIIAPKVVEKPLARLVKATQSVAEEDMRVNLRKGYIGELRLLAEGFSEMVMGLRRKRMADRELAEAEVARSRASFIDGVSAEIKTRLEMIAGDLEAGRTIGEEQVSNPAGQIRTLSATIADLNYLIRVKGNEVRFSKKEFKLCDLLAEIEEPCRSLIGGKEVALIIDCSDDASMISLSVDKQLFNIMSSALLRESLLHTDVGTVTLLPLRMSEGGIEFLSLAVSDTGHGIEQPLIDRIMKKDVFVASHLELCVARAAVEMLDGKMTVESITGKGSLITIAIPLSNPVQAVSEPSAVS
ncbi:MAG TPA: sensor histidine kinase [Dissulfurispiraceae bacterium]|nr:sensor histidine kinase [Dissulfurispiraceae bacterium]